MLGESWRSRSRRKTVSVLLATGLLVVAGVVVGCGSDDDGGSGTSDELVINSFGGTWGEAIELGFIQEFEQETGIEVELLSTADAAKSRLAVERGNEPPEDILDVSYSSNLPLAEDGLLAELDIDEDVLSEIDPEYQELFESHPYAISWGGFGLGICFDKREFPDNGPQPSGWKDFWDVSRFPGPRGFSHWGAQSREPLPEFALLADGVAPEDLYPIDEERAFAKMDELRPDIPRFAPDVAELGQQLVDGSVSMAVCFTHRVNKLIDGGADFIGISYEQGRLATDQFVVWENAPNKENAMEFLNFILEKEQQARWARVGYGAPVHPGAFEELPEEVADRIATSPKNRQTAWEKDEEYYAEEVDGETNAERLVAQFEEWLRE